MNALQRIFYRMMPYNVLQFSPAVSTVGEFMIAKKIPQPRKTLIISHSPAVNLLTNNSPSSEGLGEARQKKATGFYSDGFSVVAINQTLFLAAAQTVAAVQTFITRTASYSDMSAGVASWHITLHRFIGSADRIQTESRFCRSSISVRRFGSIRV